MSSEIATVQKLLEATGIKYKTHGMGTNIEASFEDAMRVIGQAHALLHNNGIARVYTTVSITSR